MADYVLNQWVTIEEYLIRVEDVKDEMITVRSFSSSEEVRAIRILVAYKNKRSLALKHVGLQWLLYDTDGYSYDNTILLRLFGDDDNRKLQEGYVGIGKVVKGWVAFKVPKEAVIDYVQFRKHYMTDNIATISLEKATAVAEKEPETGDKASLLQKVWQTVKPAKSDEVSFSFEPGEQYVVKKPIVDFFGNVFSVGDELTYAKRYPPYQGLHILLFTEGDLYLHENEHGDLFADMARFIEAI